jgi:hypothetical protein
MSQKEKRSPAKDKAKGPYLAMAVLCESVLEDKDGVLSAIRIVDTFRLQASSVSGEIIPPVAMPYLAPIVTFQLLIGLKAGSAKGRRKLKIVPKTPAGEIIAESVVPITLDGPKEPRGFNLRIPVTLALKGEGIYWIDVFLDSKPLTRIPLRVEFEKISRTTGASSPESKQGSKR